MPPREIGEPRAPPSETREPRQQPPRTRTTAGGRLTRKGTTSARTATRQMGQDCCSTTSRGESRGNAHRAATPLRTAYNHRRQPDLRPPGRLECRGPCRSGWQAQTARRAQPPARWHLHQTGQLHVPPRITGPLRDPSGPRQGSGKWHGTAPTHWGRVPVPIATSAWRRIPRVRAPGTRTGRVQGMAQDSK